MAAIQTLGIANLPAPPRPPAPAAPAREPVTVEVGTTGTGIFGQGYIRELGEYNSLFSGGPFTAYRTYEKMRRGDAQVAATVMAMKLPVRCAEWAVQPPQGATPAEKECAEFVEKCLFDDCDFDRTLENLLLALDFGAGCHEDIWTVTNGQVRLKKLAPRMPLTFYNWTVDPYTEDLLELVQHGFHLGAFGEFRMPADKICLYAFRQEGANYAGRAILREMYQHWYTKALLYKIDAIAAERNGMGIPTGTLGPDAKREDRDTFEGFLKRVAAHESVYVMMPQNYQFALTGVTGQVRDCRESIQHHNMQISMAGLAQFMIMGQQSKGSGNRSLGETMSDFFYLALQTVANQVGDAYSDTTIARLAAYNYGPQVRRPRLVPQQLLAMKFESMTEALSKLATAGIITPDPDIELWARQKMGAPKIERAEVVRLRQQVTSVGSGIGDRGPGNAGKGAAAEAEPGQGSGGEGAGKGKSAAPDGGNSGREGAKSGDLNDKKKEPGKIAGSEGAGVTTRREPRGAEKCLALSDIVGALDKGRAEIAAALRAARPRVQAEIVHRLVDKPVREMHRVSVAPDEKLIGAVETILRGVAEFGRHEVGKERERQMAGAAPADAARIRMAEKRAAGDAVGLYADAVVSEFENGLAARATNIALDQQRRGGMGKGELITAIGEDLDDQSDKWLDSVAAKGANEAFAEGRQDGYEEHADEIGSVIYSALLDLNTCEACAAADGEEGATPDDIPGVPNPDCDGGDKCRCVHVYVFSDEVKSKA